MVRQPGAPIEVKNVPRRGRPRKSPHLAAVQEPAEVGAIAREEQECKDAIRVYNTTVDLLADERGDEAIKIYKELIAQHGNARTLALREVVARCYFNMAGTLNALVGSAAALQTYDELFAKFPDAQGSELREIVADARINQGKILAKMGQRRGAAEAFQQAIKIDPNQRRRREIQAHLAKDYSDILQRKEAEEVDIGQKERKLLSWKTGYTGEVNGESTTPAGEPGSPRLRQRSPVPDKADHEQTRPAEISHELAQVVASGDGTLLRQWHKYKRLLTEVKLPIQDLAEARVGGKLVNTYKRARARQGKIGVELVPENDIHISQVASAVATFYEHRQRENDLRQRQDQATLG